MCHVTILNHRSLLEKRPIYRSLLQKRNFGELCDDLDSVEFKCVMAQVEISHVTHMNGECFTYE